MTTKAVNAYLSAGGLFGRNTEALQAACKNSASMRQLWATTEFTLDEEMHFAWTKAPTSGYASRKGQQVLLVIAADQSTTATIVRSFSGF